MAITSISGVSGLQAKRQIFTTSGNFTVPSNVNSVKVTCIGGGASRGGAGGVAQTLVDTSALYGTNIAVTVGAATAASTYGNAGASSFGSFVTAGGGFTSDATSTAGVSGTTFISGRSISAQPTLSTYASTYANLESSTSGVIYNPVGGFYTTMFTYFNPSVGNTYTYYTSTDGLSWTRRNSVAPIAAANNYAWNMHYANGRTFVTFYNASLWYTTSSANGTTWTTAWIWNNSGTVSNYLNDIMYSSTSGLYYFFGQNPNTTSPAIWSSTAANIVTPAGAQIAAFTLGTTNDRNPMNGRFLSNGSNLAILWSVNSTGSVLQYTLFNGSTWAALATSTVGNSTNYPVGGAWDGTKFTIVLADGTIHTSTNLTTWTATGTTVSGLIIFGYSGSNYYGSINGQFAYSANGTTWTAIHWILPGITNWIPIGVNGTKHTSLTSGGLIGTFDIASPNTTIAAGYPGVIGTSSAIGGGAGSSPRSIATGTTTVNDADGVDGYGRSIVNTALPPSSYGSTNGLTAQQGAVIVEWLQ